MPKYPTDYQSLIFGLIKNALQADTDAQFTRWGHILLTIARFSREDAQ